MRNDIRVEVYMMENKNSGKLVKVLEYDGTPFAKGDELLLTLKAKEMNAFSCDTSTYECDFSVDKVRRGYDEDGKLYGIDLFCSLLRKDKL
jgi:hypothetical protein